ncbi:lactate dehydrogenase/glycoside hydrolase, family 4 protein [Tanacetum coccineum]
MQKSASSLALGPGGLDIAQSFFKPIHGASQPSTTSRNTKISVIGVRNTSSVVRCLTLKHAATFLSLTTIFASVDYLSTTGSDLVILTVGARHLPGEYRFNLVQRNLALFSKIIPPLSAASPEAILLIVSNPVDVLTYVAWKLSGLPANRVISLGTNLDCSRFWFLIADHLDVNAQDVQINIGAFCSEPKLVFATQQSPTWRPIISPLSVSSNLTVKQEHQQQQGICFIGTKRKTPPAIVRLLKKLKEKKGPHNETDGNENDNG